MTPRLTRQQFGALLLGASLMTFGCSSEVSRSRLSVLSYESDQPDECTRCWEVFLDCQADDGTSLEGCEERIIQCATGQTDEQCHMPPTPQEGLHCIAGYEACTATGEALGIDVRFDCSQGLQACLWASNPNPCDDIAYPAEDGSVDGCSECDMIQWELQKCYLDGGFPVPEPVPAPAPGDDSDPPSDVGGSDEPGSGGGGVIVDPDPNPDRCRELEQLYYDICVGPPDPCFEVCDPAPKCPEGQDTYTGDDGEPHPCDDTVSCHWECPQPCVTICETTVCPEGHDTFIGEDGEEHPCGDVGYCYTDCGGQIDPVDPPPVCIDCMTCDGTDPEATTAEGIPCSDIDRDRCAEQCGC